MADPKDKIIALLEKQRKAIEAQREASEKIRQEREKAAIDETALPSPSQSQLPNK